MLKKFFFSVPFTLNVALMLPVSFLFFSLVRKAFYSKLPLPSLLGLTKNKTPGGCFFITLFIMYVFSFSHITQKNPYPRLCYLGSEGRVWVCRSSLTQEYILCSFRLLVACVNVRMACAGGRCAGGDGGECVNMFCLLLHAAPRRTQE